MLGLLTTLLAGGALAEQGEVAPIQITFSRAADGWEIVVNSDGSGSVTYGSTFGDFATFPKATVAFGSLVQTTKGRKIVNSQDQEAVNVFLTKPKQQTTYGETRALAKDWDSLCLQIQPHLRSLYPDRFNQLMKKHPLAKNLPDIPVKKLELPKGPKPKPSNEKIK